MARPFKCKFCGGGRSVGKGYRCTKTLGRRQVRLCKACGRKFTPQNQKRIEEPRVPPQQANEAEGATEESTEDVTKEPSDEPVREPSEEPTEEPSKEPREEVKQTEAERSEERETSPEPTGERRSQWTS